MRRKALSLILATGILMTVSISFAGYSISANTGSGIENDLGLIQVEKVPNYLNYVMENLSCEGIHYYSDGNELLNLGNTINADGTNATDKDDFTISFSAQSNTASAALVQINNALGGNTGCTGTIDFAFSFPQNSNIDINALVENSDAYFQVRTATNPNSDTILPLSNWHVSNNQLASTGTEVSYLKGDTTNKTLTLSVLITDHSLGGSAISDDPYLYSMADLFSTYASFNSQYTLVLDLDLSTMTNLTLSDFSGVTLSVNASKGI